MRGPGIGRGRARATEVVACAVSLEARGWSTTKLTRFDASLTSASRPGVLGAAALEERLRSIFPLQPSRH